MFLVADHLPGRLWIMPCPQAEDLQVRIDAYRAAGADTVVSLLPKEEMSDLGIAQEPQLCTDRGITFISHPIVDFGLPDFTDFAELTAQIADRVKRGGSVAVHCRAGIGRSGMACAATLVQLGSACDDAIAKVTQARGVSIPDTMEQRRFLHDFASRLN